MNRGAHITETQSSVLPPSGRGGAASPQEEQDTPWINALSAVSRPAVSLLQKYLPGLLQTRSLNDTIPEWVSEAQRQTLSGQEVAILRKFGDKMPFIERSLHSNAGRPVETRSESNMTWMTGESLSGLGIIDGGNIETEHDQGRFSSAITRGHVLLNAASSAEAASSLLQSDRRSAAWWGGLWGSDDGAQSWLSKLGKGEGLHAAHCPPPPGRTKAHVAQTTALFVQFSRWELTASENAGHSGNTQQPVNNGRLECPQPESLKCSDALLLQAEPSISGSSVCPGTATGFSEVAVLTPEQDNGYSSLEEGHALCQPHTVQAFSKEELQVGGSVAMVELVNPEPTEGPSQAAEGTEEEAAEEEEEEEACIVGGSGGGVNTTPQENSTADSSRLTSPFCQNRAIAFIMGSPCSDDDDDDSDDLSGSEYSDCDDGFDSEGSSDISDSDSDDSNSDDEVDSEADRLWNSLCRPQDPYNLHHFTAPIVTAPRPIPSTSAAAAAALSSDSSPDPSPDKGASPAVSLALSVSPPALQHPDSWDDSTSASEAEDADGLLNYFSSTSDPYSPWNFQAQRSTAAPAEVQQEEGRQGKNKSLKTPPRSAHQAAATSSLPQYRREEAEDRLDSGFSEPLPPASASLVPSQSCAVLKKVRFCEEVEEFVTSSREEEDRRGQWEELARDRCRFSRRCRDVEQSIAYCLEPQHRTLVYQRITTAVQDPES